MQSSYCVVGLSVFVLIIVILLLCCLAAHMAKDPACKPKQEECDQATKPAIPNTTTLNTLAVVSGVFSDAYASKRRDADEYELRATRILKEPPYEHETKADRKKRSDDLMDMAEQRRKEASLCWDLSQQFKDARTKFDPAGTNPLQ